MQSVVILQQPMRSGIGIFIQREFFTIPTKNDDVADREQGATFNPKFDANGLLTAVVTHARTGEVLMVAFMDTEALEKTIATGLAHFHSRSRGRLWMKGESSGNILKVDEILIDCDQDTLVLKSMPAGPACHTGAPSCFYRKLQSGRLMPVEPES